MVRSFRSQLKALSIVQPQPASRPLFLRDFPPFASPDPSHSILAYMPTAIPQQSGDPPIAVAPVFAGQRHDLSCQRIFVRSVEHFVALCPSPLPQQPAGMPLRYLIALACMPDRATPPLEGLEVSLCHILQNLLLQRQLRHQPLQLGILPLQLLETLGLIEF